MVKVTKKELELLEKIFAKEIVGSVYTTKSNLAKKLEDEGYIVKIRRELGKDCLGQIVIEGYVLTYTGNFAYCSSLKEED